MEVEFHEGGHHRTRLGRHQYPARPSTTSHWDDMHQSATQQAVKAVTAITAGGSLMILSALNLTVAVIGLTMATPLLVIFCPILVPAVIAMVLIAGGFMAAGGLGVASISVLSWIYRYVTGRHPVGADQIDEARMKIAWKARDLRDRSADWAHHHNPLGGRQYETTTTTAAA